MTQVMPKVVATKPRRGVENTGRGGVRSIAEHETPVNCVNKSNPEGVTEFLSYLRHFIYLLHLSRGSFSATLRKRLLRRRASLRSTTCLYSCQAFGLRCRASLGVAFVHVNHCFRACKPLLSCDDLNALVVREQWVGDKGIMPLFDKLTCFVQ